MEINNGQNQDVETQKSQIKDLKESTEEQEEQIEELLLSGGAGCISFLTGYIHGLIQIIGKERLKEFKIGGVSAGAIISGLLHFCIHQDKYDMKYFWNQLLRKPFEQKYKLYYGFFTTGNVLRYAAYEYFKLRKEIPIPSPDGTVHCVTTVLGKWFMPKKQIINQFEDPEVLGDILESTCNIPYVISKQFFSNYKGQKTLDGGFTHPIPYKYEKSQKIFLNIMPKCTTLPSRILQKPKNIQYLHITEGTGISFPKDYWLWSDEWADEMFLKGVIAANEQAEMLIKAFNKSKQNSKFKK